MILPRLNMVCRWEVRLAKRENAQKSVFYLDCARAGIVLALQTLGLSKHSKVGMMIYNCDSVMNAITAAGHEVVFVDVTPQLTIDIEHLTLRAADMQVLVVSHLFGIVNDIVAIQERFPHLIIIEDCAHAMGCDCGKVGDFAVYSIGQGKFPSIGQGGILQVNNPVYQNQIAETISELPKLGVLAMLKQYIKTNIIGCLCHPLIYTFFTRKVKNKIVRAADTSVIHPKQMSALIKGWYMADKLHIPDYVAQQMQNVAIWKEYLQRSGVDCNFFNTKNGFMLPVWSEQLLPAMRGIETATHFAQCINWARTFGYMGDCPCAEDMVKHLTMLPCYYTLTEKQLKKQLYGK